MIKSILGMVIPDRGKLFVHDKLVSRDFSYRQNIGYMPQIGRYPDNMSVGQILDMIKELRGFKTAPDEDLLKAFKLESIYHKRMRTLSGGTTQKVSATLAFLFNPLILILDEPTAGLDPLASEILKEKILLEKKNGKLIMITSHLLSELDDLITELIFMNEAMVQFHQSVGQLQQTTGEEKISKAIAHILKQRLHEPNN